MLLGRDCRVVMGPCRDQQLLSIVALVPDSAYKLIAALFRLLIGPFRVNERTSFNIVDC